MVPTMFVRLLKLPDETKRKYDLSSLKFFVVHAAAPCSPEVKQEMIKWWGPVIDEYYGATETGGGGGFTRVEEALRKPGTVGSVQSKGEAYGWYDDPWATGLVQTRSARFTFATRDSRGLPTMDVDEATARDRT